MMIKVAVVDDHSIFRSGLISVLSKKNNIAIILEAGNGKEFIDLLSSKKIIPDVLLLDIQMPVMDGYATLDFIHQHYPNVKVVMISLIQDSVIVKSLMQRGAAGFIAKNAEPEAIIEIVEKMALSLTVNPSKNIVIPDFNKTNLNVLDAAVLTEKEYELLKYAASAFTYNQIAERMLITPKALDHHRTSLFLKLNVNSRQELAAISVRMGLSN